MQYILEGAAVWLSPTLGVMQSSLSCDQFIYLFFVITKPAPNNEWNGGEMSSTIYITANDVSFVKILHAHSPLRGRIKLKHNRINLLLEI